MIIMLGKSQYIKTVNAKGLFDNTYETRIPQTVVNKIILKHFEKADKKPKCLFIGWDGCRADSMKYLIKSADEKISGHNESNIYSAVSALKKSGGLYITYVGGDNGLLQQTSTAQGWSSALCGKWLKPQWRTGANWSLDEDYPTALKKLACEGYKTSFNAQWPEHFTNTYLLENQYAQKIIYLNTFINLTVINIFLSICSNKLQVMLIWFSEFLRVPITTVIVPGGEIRITDTFRAYAVLTPFRTI